MTRKEFLQKFNSSYSSTLKKYTSPETLKQNFAAYSENGTTMSNEELAIWAFIESNKFTKEFLQTVLEDVLEFDDQVYLYQLHIHSL